MRNNFLPFHQKNKSSGFELLELLIVIFIIGVGLLAILGGMGYLFHSVQESWLVYQANLLNQRNIEYVRMLRDTSWNNNIATLETNTIYYPTDTSGTILLSTSNPGTLYGYFTSSIALADTYRDANGNLASSGTPEPDVVKIISTTTWTYRGQAQSTQLTTYIGNVYDN